MQKRLELLEELVYYLKQRMNLQSYGSSLVAVNKQINRLEQQLASLPKEQSVTDEDIEEKAKQVGFDQLDVELTNYELMQYKIGYVDGAKDHRDGLIKKTK